MKQEEIKTVTLNYVAASDLVSEASEAHKKEYAALRALYNELGIGSELSEIRLAYLKAHFEEIGSLFNIVLDYHKELGEGLEVLDKVIESQEGIGA